MKLPGPYRIEITGDPARFRTESLRRSSTGFAYLLDRLFSGETVAEKELLSWGLSVTVIEPDEFVAVRRGTI